MPVLTSGQQERKSKQRKIRNSEYYDMEGTLDRLYAESKKDKTFNHLMEIIESEENIKLAYRTIKKNTGSDTSGVDKRTIADLAKLSEEEYVRLIRKQFSNYHPRPVRRVEIPKPNGKTRPLEEVGKHIDVTRERIRQIEGKALNKLKKSARFLVNG